MTFDHVWVGLRQAGNLLGAKALEQLPHRGPAPLGLALDLRAALVDLPADGAVEGPALSRLLDLVLEGVCGLVAGWRKGSDLGPTDAEKLADGTVVKPRRLWVGPGDERLAVFVTPTPRLGVHRGRRPVAHATEYLRKRNLPLGLITNGTEWRLLWADVDNLAWVQWTADRWLEGDRPTDELLLLRRVLSFAALTRKTGTHSPLLEAIRATRRGEAKLSQELGERVRRAVELFLRARRPVIDPTWGEHATTDLYTAACHLVMRLVVLSFAEARELLPLDNPVYHQAYGLRGLVEQLDRLTPERRQGQQSAWPRLLGLFRLLHRGSPHPAIEIRRYGGELFADGDLLIRKAVERLELVETPSPAVKSALDLLEGPPTTPRRVERALEALSGESHEAVARAVRLLKRLTGLQRALGVLEDPAHAPDDEVIHQMLRLLTRTTQRVRDGSGWRMVAEVVNFTELTSEYIGILYEGLLDYELHRAGEQPVVFLALGDQPALPLDRLEGMDDKALAALVEKAKVKRSAAAEDEGDDAEEDAEPEDDAPEAAEVEAPPTAPAEELVLDDARAEARARAVAWGRRAALMGKLVRAPKGKKGATDPAFLAELDQQAEALVADLKLPGELFLVRWGGTRKGAGTFYTRPQLTMPTVRRTLEPLIGSDGDWRPPEALLALKVCDPAMGSGSFLVAALRVLAEALVKSLYQHGRITVVDGRTSIRCEAIPEADRDLPTEGFDDRLAILARRVVVEHCLYGVDLDPLAVELARVALWVETLDHRLPFTFLDHKLRCGDSLTGAWLDRFRDYPLLAFDRASPDHKWKGVHHPADQWHKALKERKAAVVAEQAGLLTGQERLLGGTSDDELKAAVDRVRRLYRDLRKVPSDRPDEVARIWRERIHSDPAMDRVRTAFDTWCALWFWPLDRLADAPGPRALHAPSPAAAEVVKATRDRVRFFHWELEFPDVFTEEGAGFHAVVGNPPWETQKPNSKEFFSNHDPLYRAYGKQEALGVQRRLFEVRPELEEAWLAYNGLFKDRGNFVKYAAEPFGDAAAAGHEGGAVTLKRGAEGDALHKTWRSRRARFTGTSDPRHPFRHQGSADLNTYKLFVEVGHALLRSSGQLGMLVPSGLYTDKGSGDLRKLLLQGCAWRWLYGFENREKIFDIDSRFKFCVCIAEKGARTVAIRSAFMRHDLEDWADARAVLDYPAERVAGFSPNSLSVLEIRSERDLEVLTKLYANGVLLGDDGPNGWGIQYAREFDMTNDSKLFIARDKAEAEGYIADDYGRWVKQGETLLPLYEGRMVGQFDFSEKGWVSGKGRSAEWEDIPWNQKSVRPQYLINSSSDGAAQGRPFKCVIMNIGSATNRRSLFSAVVPDWPANHSLAVLQPAAEADAIDLCLALDSFAYDWSLRNRLGGLNISWFVLEETPLPRRRGGRALAAALIAGHVALSGVSLYAGRHRPALQDHERLRIRCILDAIVGALYGLDLDDLKWVLRDCDHPSARLSEKSFCRQLDPKGFWRVDKAGDPELRHTVLSLLAFRDLQTSISAAAGSVEQGIRAFCEQNDGDGWMLPETLCIAELGLTRTVDVGVYDERARTPQPVRSRMGERFLPWQLAQTPEESWAECERHARALREGTAPPPSSAAPAVPSGSTAPLPAQPSLFDRT